MSLGWIDELQQLEAYGRSIYLIIYVTTHNLRKKSLNYS